MSDRRIVRRIVSMYDHLLDAGVNQAVLAQFVRGGRRIVKRSGADGYRRTRSEPYHRPRERQHLRREISE